MWTVNRNLKSHLVPFAEPLNYIPNIPVDIYADVKLVRLKLEAEDLTGSYFNHF